MWDIPVREGIDGCIVFNPAVTRFQTAYEPSSVRADVLVNSDNSQFLSSEFSCPRGRKGSWMHARSHAHRQHPPVLRLPGWPGCYPRGCNTSPWSLRHGSWIAQGGCDGQQELNFLNGRIQKKRGSARVREAIGEGGRLSEEKKTLFFNCLPRPSFPPHLVRSVTRTTALLLRTRASGSLRHRWARSSGYSGSTFPFFFLLKSVTVRTSVLTVTDACCSCGVIIYYLLDDFDTFSDSATGFPHASPRCDEINDSSRLRVRSGELVDTSPLGTSGWEDQFLWKDASSEIL